MKISSHNRENNQKPFKKTTQLCCLLTQYSIANQIISKMRDIVTRCSKKYRFRNSTRRQRVKTTKYQLRPSSKPSGYYRVSSCKAFKSKRTRNHEEIIAMFEHVLIQARRLNQENVSNQPSQLNQAPHQAHVLIQPIRLNQAPDHRRQRETRTVDDWEEFDC